MFLDLVTRRNPALLEAAVQLHQTGQILPDTYVLDLDAIVHNTKVLAETAQKEGLELFYMSKQIGRNPLVAKAISEAGISKAVVVDYKEALRLMEAGLPLGHVGHLVQVPTHILKKIMAYGVDYVTVFSLEKLKEIDALARDLGIQQKVLIKIIEPDDIVYPGQFGGFSLEGLAGLLEEKASWPGVLLAGLTSFPCFLFSQGDLLETPNARTLQKASAMMREAGLNPILNLPSATCVKTIPKIKELGGHQGEPGHALTGTTPLHALEDLAEIPALVYVSEVSHNLAGHAYVYGGGHYRRGHMENLLVCHQQERVQDSFVPLQDDSIDYYLETQNAHPVGATVLAAFRTQVFVTRSDVALVSGISQGTPKLVGLFDSLGNPVKR